LLIKRMQAQHETLGRIAQKIKNTSDEQVVQALTELARPSKKSAEAELHLVEWTADPEIEEAPDRDGPMKRLELGSGCAVEVPERALNDPRERRRLADDLASLAEWLRASLPRDE
jgi:hypothetical protein